MGARRCSMEEQKRVRFYLHEKQHEASPHAIFIYFHVFRVPAACTCQVLARHLLFLQIVNNKVQILGGY